MKYKISEEVAREQMEGLFNYYGIDETGNEPLIRAWGRLKLAVRRGLIEVLDGGEVKQIFFNPPGDVTDITYKQPSGKIKMSIDKIPEAKVHKRLYTFLGGLSGIGEAGISSLSGPDLSIAECLGLVFMSA